MLAEALGWTAGILLIATIVCATIAVASDKRRVTRRWYAAAVTFGGGVLLTALGGVWAYYATSVGWTPPAEAVQGILVFLAILAFYAVLMILLD